MFLEFLNCRRRESVLRTDAMSFSAGWRRCRVSVICLMGCVLLCAGTASDVLGQTALSPSRTDSAESISIKAPSATVTTVTNVADVPAAMFEYVARPEPEFAWHCRRSLQHEQRTVHLLEVTSQKWHDIVWKHSVEIYEPKELSHPGHALLFVTGGSRLKDPDEGDLRFGTSLADLCGARVIVLRQVPNQPLFGGKVEDDLITETWLRYLESGDTTWPLLFPMVKSAVKTMDAVQQFTNSQGRQTGPDSSAQKYAVEHFVIAGASKRGWTSWLTPVVDQRIVATAPIVIDVLNFRAQMQHQLKTWGRFSDQIIDYTRKGLVKGPDEAETDREVALRTMMDPYTYRKRLTLPKLLIVGTNDPYWVVDSMNLYWDELAGPKFVRQVPNAGHSLNGGRDAALTTLAVFFRHIAAGQDLPDVAWEFQDGADQLRLQIRSTAKPSEVRLWTARSTDPDFRNDQWEAQVVTASDGVYVGRQDVPAEGHVAMFGEVEFQFHDLPWSITTLVYRR